MENGKVFLVVAVGIGAFTALNLASLQQDLPSKLRNNTYRLDYYQKAQNSHAKRMNRTALFSYFKPAFEKQFWTASQTRADKTKLLLAADSSNPTTRKNAALKITNHKTRLGTGKKGKAEALYNYYG